MPNLVQVAMMSCFGLKSRKNKISTPKGATNKMQDSFSDMVSCRAEKGMNASRFMLTRMGSACRLTLALLVSSI